MVYTKSILKGHEHLNAWYIDRISAWTSTVFLDRMEHLNAKYTISLSPLIFLPPFLQWHRTISKRDLMCAMKRDKDVSIHPFSVVYVYVHMICMYAYVCVRMLSRGCFSLTSRNSSISGSENFSCFYRLQHLCNCQGQKGKMVGGSHLIQCSIGLITKV
jgi:hypothetical protein